MEIGILILLVGLLVGGLGSMLGIGGGVLLIPLLTSLFDIPIKTAIGASIVSVIATSSAAGAVYVGRGLANTRLAMVLEIATTLGAIPTALGVLAGAQIGTRLGGRVRSSGLKQIFQGLLLVFALMMFYRAIRGWGVI